jgi:hypothetical protein
MKHMTLKILVVVVALVIIHLLAGCTVVWSDDVFVATFLKKYDATALEMIAEPNYLQIGAGVLKTKNTSVTIITPAGVGIGTGD